MPKVSKIPKSVKGVTVRPGAFLPYQAAVNMLMPNGTRLRLKQSFATSAEAEAWRAAMRADRLRQQRGLPTPETTSEYLSRWLAKYQRRPDRKARTIEDKQQVLQRAKLLDAAGQPGRSALGQIKLAALTATVVEEQLLEVVRTRGATAARHLRSALSTAFAEAVKRHDLPFNPAAGFDLPARSIQKPVPPRRWIEDASEAHTIIGHAQDAMSDAAMFPAFMLLLGLRVGEAAGAQWGDVTGGAFHVQRAVEYLQGGRIVVGTPKTTKSRRTLVLGDLTKELLQQYRAWTERRGGTCTPDAYLFPDDTGQPTAYTVLRGRWNRTRTALGLPAMSLYAMRHGHAVLLLEAGTPIHSVAEALGHTSAGLVLNTYGGTVKTAGADRAKVLDKALRPPANPQPAGLQLVRSA